jgi:PKD domain
VPLTEVAPTGAGAAGVRYVRMTVIADQTHIDYGFLDFAELAVFGHHTPAGSLSATPAAVRPGDAVAFDASSFTTDERAAIGSYAWDFDGNGTVDRTTTTPTTSTTYGTAGAYTASVTVSDDLGGAGTAKAGVTVATGGSTQPPPTGTARPKVSFPKAPKGAARFKVTCDGSCNAAATLVLSRKVAKQLGRHRRTLASRSLKLTGSRTVTLKLSKAFRKALKKRHVRSFKAELRVVVKQGKTTRRITKTVRIRP